MGLIRRGCAGGTVRHGVWGQQAPDMKPCFRDSERGVVLVWCTLFHGSLV